MASFVYRYELRHGEELIATGRLSRERALEVGERMRSAAVPGSFARSSQSWLSASST
jgi:hypothetical protein